MYYREVSFLAIVRSKNREAHIGQCLVGSLNGAFSSKKVTEEFIKVGLARMEIGQDVQTQKLA